MEEGVEPDPELVVAEADNALVLVGGARLEIGRLEIQKDRWLTRNVRGTVSRMDRPAMWFEAEEVEILPGKTARTQKISMEIGGVKIGPWPAYSFSLDNRVNTFKLPKINRRPDSDYGLAWTHEHLLSEHLAVQAGWGLYPGSYPSWDLTFAYSPLSSNMTSARIFPQSDLEERARDGWFNNIRIRTPDGERERLQRRRVTYSLSTRWNRSTVGRPINFDSVNIPLDAAVEFGGPSGGGGWLAQARLQKLQKSHGEGFVQRATASGSLISAPLPLGEKTELRARGDLFSSVSRGNDYGWVRGELGVVYRAAEHLTFGMAYVRGVAGGTPDFAFDPLFSSNAGHIRFDYKSGPYTFRWLAKYDFDLNSWFDREYELAIVADGFEPFIAIRQQPDEIHFGIRVRMDELQQILQKGKIDRTPER
jgi:hypothetical protein